MPWGKACLICGVLSFSLPVDYVSAAEDTGAGGDIASSAQHADPDGSAIVERQLQDADEQLIRSEPYLHLLGTYQAWSPITSGVSIQRAIALALKRDVSLAAAREQVVEADYAKKNAVWSYLPRITASTEFAQVDQSVINTDNQVFQEGDATFKTLVAQLELVQPIFDLARIRGLHIAEGERAAASPWRRRRPRSDGALPVTLQRWWPASARLYPFPPRLRACSCLIRHCALATGNTQVTLWAVCCRPGRPPRWWGISPSCMPSASVRGTIAWRSGCRAAVLC